MRLLRGLGGTVLLVLSAALGLVAVILCVTLILVPLGLPLLEYSRRLFTLSVKLMLPRAVSHPLKSSRKPIGRGGRHLKDRLGASMPGLKKARKRGIKKARRLRRRAPLFS